MGIIRYICLWVSFLSLSCQTIDTPSGEPDWKSPESPASANASGDCYRWLVDRTHGKTVIISWQHPELKIEFQHRLVVYEEANQPGPLLAVIDDWGHSFELRSSQSPAAGFPCEGHQQGICFWYIPAVDGEPRLEVQLRHHSNNHYVLSNLRQLQQQPSPYPRAMLSPLFSNRDLLEEDRKLRLEQLRKSAGPRAWTNYQRCLNQQ